MAAVRNVYLKIKMRFSYKSEPFQPNEPEAVGTERNTSEIYCTGGTIKWRERKVNWMNIIRGGTLNT